MNIRPFIDGKDELIYIDIINRARKEFSDIKPLTLEDALFGSKAPNYNPTGRFIAEWNNIPTGYIYACLDPKRDDKHGYMDGPYVVPEFRRQHIGTALAQAAMQSFKEREISIIESGASSNNITAQTFLEKFGFQLHHVYSRMSRTLQQMPENTGRNKSIEICEAGNSDDALKTVNNLTSESMKEHYNFQRMTFEEIQYYTRGQEKLGVKYNNFIAYNGSMPVGFLTTIIDPNEIEHQKKNVAWFSVLGVLKPYRSQGIGKALMIHAMRFLKEKAAEQVYLEVDDTNVYEAVKIYEKLGFEVILKYYRYIKEIK